MKSRADINEINQVNDVTTNRMMVYEWLRQWIKWFVAVGNQLLSWRSMIHASSKRGSDGDKRCSVTRVTTAVRIIVCSPGPSDAGKVGF
jgi:hypothetical protein